MRPRTKRVLAWTLGIVGALLLVAVAAFLVWALTPLGPQDRALDALEPGGGIAVTETGHGWVFEPTAEDPTAGFVFYPGGHVDARSYAPLVRAVAEKGYYAVLLRVPLSLAVFDMGAAGPALDAAPASVRTWVVGGHSLGGVAASAFTHDDDRADGLVLLASYPTASANLSGTDVAVTSLAGTRDGGLDWTVWASSASLLPDDAVFEKIEGANHAQFGDYGPQPGDKTATISRAEQQRIAVSRIVRTLEAAE